MPIPKHTSGTTGRVDLNMGSEQDRFDPKKKGAGGVARHTSRRMGDATVENAGARHSPKTLKSGGPALHTSRRMGTVEPVSPAARHNPKKP